MSAIRIAFSLMIALLVMLLLYPRRKVKPQIAAYGSQRMCPACGLITSRLEACCLECGESLSAVSVTQIVGR
jgi:predicted amidophosphoribosyltransferase